MLDIKAYLWMQWKRFRASPHKWIQKHRKEMCYWVRLPVLTVEDSGIDLHVPHLYVYELG